MRGSQPRSPGISRKHFERLRKAVKRRKTAPVFLILTVVGKCLRRVVEQFVYATVYIKAPVSGALRRSLKLRGVAIPNIA